MARQRLFVLVLSLTGLVTAIHATAAQDAREPITRRPAPTSRTVPRDDADRRPPTTVGSNAPFENQLRKFSAPLSANGSK